MRTLSRTLNALVERFLPSPLIFAILLTLITLVLGMLLGGQSLVEMAEHWYGGFWGFLEFTMQMLVILITGYALAKAPLVNRGLNWLASKPGTQTSALLTTCAVAGALGMVNWGLGFVAGTVVAIEIAKRLQKADFRLLVAASYASVIATQPISISLSAPLLVNTPGHSLEDEIGLIPVTQTIYSPTMLSIGLLGFAGIVMTFLLMAPKGKEVVSFAQARARKGSAAPDDVEAAAPSRETVADRVNHSRALTYLVVFFALIAVIMYFISQGFNLELNIINFIFLFLGLALHGSPQKYIECITRGIPVASGIVVQFPFYAGIMGMMAGSGLMVLIGSWFASISTEYTFPLFTYISAMIVNVFVPSAGGQWQVMGPVMVEAMNTLGVSAPTVVNAISVGDQTTNLLQPFFALPALGLSGLALRDIWGFCMTAMLVLFIVCATIFLLVPVLGW